MICGRCRFADPSRSSLLVVGHDQCVEFAVVFQHERFQHGVHAAELVLDLLGIDVLTASVRIIVLERPRM